MICFFAVYICGLMGHQQFIITLPVCTEPTGQSNKPCGLFDPAYPCRPMGHSNKRYHGLGGHEAVLYQTTPVQALALVLPFKHCYKSLPTPCSRVNHTGHAGYVDHGTYAACLIICRITATYNTRTHHKANSPIHKARTSLL